MKTKKIITAMIFIITVVSFSNISSLSSFAKSNNITYEEDFKRTIQLMLYSYINDEVQEQYGENVHTAIYDINLETVTIKSPIDIVVETIIHPYTGPHNTISTDKVTLRIGIDTVKIINYVVLSS